ncbi:MAG: transporter [Deltaproteobacteria bacterium]|nr:MAG: transporter [Deltaproteobacteria bacterium]
MLRVVLLIFTTVLLSGCMMGPDFQKPDLTAPETFRFAETVAEVEDEVNLKWWELFSDPILASLVRTALQNNLDVKIAVSRIEEARATLGFTKADLYPMLNIEGSAQKGNFNGRGRSDTTDKSAYIAPVLSWELDFWGKYRRSNESARAVLLASESSLRTIQISLISEVVSTYHLLLDFRQRLELSRHTFVSRQNSLDIIQKRFDRGIIPEIDVNQAQIQKEIAVAAIPLYKRLIAKAENLMSILLGQYPEAIKTGEALRLQPVPPAIPIGLSSTILERRPDVAEALLLLEAQTAKIGVAEAMRFPAISLTGLWGVASAELGSVIDTGEIWSIGAGLTGPIFNWNKNIRRVNIEEERTRQALLNYEKIVLQAYREVADALTEIETLKIQLASVGRKNAAAKNANRLSKLRYDKGATSYLEVLDTERTLFAVGLELSELEQQYHNAFVKLYKALGGGWLSKDEMDKAQQAPE